MFGNLSHENFSDTRLYILHVPNAKSTALSRSILNCEQGAGFYNLFASFSEYFIKNSYKQQFTIVYLREFEDRIIKCCLLTSA